MTSEIVQSCLEKMNRIEQQLMQLKQAYARDIAIRNMSNKKMNVSLIMYGPGDNGDSFQSQIQVPQFTQYSHRIQTEVYTIHQKTSQELNDPKRVNSQREPAQRYQEKAFKTDKTNEKVNQVLSKSKMEQRIREYKQRLRNLALYQLQIKSTTIDNRPPILSDKNQTIIEISDGNLIPSDQPSEGRVKINYQNKNRQVDSNRLKLARSFLKQPENEDYRPFSLLKQVRTHKNKQGSLNKQVLHCKKDLNYQKRNEVISRRKSKSDKELNQRYLNVGESAHRKQIDKDKKDRVGQLQSETNRSITALSPLKKSFQSFKPISKVKMSPQIKFSTPIQPKRADQLYLERHNSFLYSKGTPNPKDFIFPRQRSKSDHQSMSKQSLQDKYKISPKAKEVTDRLHSRSNKKTACDHQSRFQTLSSRKKFDLMLKNNNFALRNLNKQEQEVLFNNLKEKREPVELWPKKIAKFVSTKIKQAQESKCFTNF